MSLILFFKSHVGAYLRGGKIVNVAGYQGKTARGTPAAGQRSLFDADEHGEVPPARSAYREPQHAEPTKELVAEHEHLVDVLRSPSHADDKVEAGKQAEELKELKQEAGERQPVLSPRDLSSEDRAHWSELHEQHKRLVYHDVRKHAAKREKLVSQMQEHEATSHSAMLDEMQSASFGDSQRALQMNETKNSFKQKAREAGSKIDLHDRKTSELQSKISDLAERKGKMVSGTHDLRFDTASQSLRSDEAEAAFAKDEMKRQRSMKPEPMAKSIIFLSRPR